MSASTFDTLRVARDLEAAGVERKQAEAHAEALRQAVTANRDELATKGDIAGVRADLVTIRWTSGLLAVFVFAIGLRVFGLL